MKIFNLAKRFENFALDIPALDMPPGRIYGLIGPNGSGKTTLMKIIAGLMLPDGGRIDYGGLSPRDITMVFRKPYLLRDTVERNVIYPLKIRHAAPDDALVDYYLTLAGLRDHRKAYAPGLSSGQGQKLALIRAMVFSPQLMLIDEAFSALDMASAEAFEQLILERQRENPATVIVCGHQLSHIQRLCDYVFFMDRGRVEAEGPTADILRPPPRNSHRPLHRYLQHTAIGG